MKCFMSIIYAKRTRRQLHKSSTIAHAFSSESQVCAIQSVKSSVTCKAIGLWKKCNLTLAMSPTCHSNNTLLICRHEFKRSILFLPSPCDMNYFPLFLVKSGQKAMHMSPPCNLHRCGGFNKTKMQFLILSALISTHRSLCHPWNQLSLALVSLFSPL